jgi:pSer/pThr/pTyr-binding forkhead associated (FHA) protein
MEFHQTLDKFFKMYGRIEKKDFVDVFSDPFLAFDLDGIAPKDFDDYAESSRAKSATVCGDLETIRMSRVLVAPVVKSDRNQAAGIITLGRADKCDVVIPHQSVSKFHASLEYNPAYRSYTIQEAGSSFGTLLDGRNLQPGESYPLKSGAELIFAEEVGAVFFTSGDFHDFMAKAAGGKS